MTRLLSFGDLSPAHRQALDAMKDQLIIVLLLRLGAANGPVTIPVQEIDEAPVPFVLSMRLDADLRQFEFVISRKDGT